jgi:hypothetical protein
MGGVDTNSFESSWSVMWVVATRKETSIWVKRLRELGLHIALNLLHEMNPIRK